MVCLQSLLKAPIFTSGPVVVPKWLLKLSLPGSVVYPIDGTDFDCSCVVGKPLNTSVASIFVYMLFMSLTGGFY